MICIYRYSDKGKQPSNYGYYFNKRDCLDSFQLAFPFTKTIIVADNCEPDTVADLRNTGLEVRETNLGNSASFRYCVDLALKQGDDIYFAEDDYLYKERDCAALLKEGLAHADYATLYDHGDKYPEWCRFPNPAIGKLGEVTTVFRSESCHWKFTNSTTLTFAVSRAALVMDAPVLKSFCTDGRQPDDWGMFCELAKRERKVASSIPAFSTHLSPNLDTAPFFFKS